MLHQCFTDKAIESMRPVMRMPDGSLAGMLLSPDILCLRWLGQLSWVVVCGVVVLWLLSFRREIFRTVYDNLCRGDLRVRVHHFVCVIHGVATLRVLATPSKRQSSPLTQIVFVFSPSRGGATFRLQQHPTPGMWLNQQNVMGYDCTLHAVDEKQISQTFVQTLLQYADPNHKPAGESNPELWRAAVKISRQRFSHRIRLSHLPVGTDLRLKIATVSIPAWFCARSLPDLEAGVSAQLPAEFSDSPEMLFSRLLRNILN